MKKYHILMVIATLTLGNLIKIIEKNKIFL
jgi:hypothetical protein